MRRKGRFVKPLLDFLGRWLHWQWISNGTAEIMFDYLHPSCTPYRGGAHVEYFKLKDCSLWPVYFSEGRNKHFWGKMEETAACAGELWLPYAGLDFESAPDAAKWQ